MKWSENQYRYKFTVRKWEAESWVRILEIGGTPIGWTIGIKLSKRPEKNNKGLEELLRKMEKQLITNNLKAWRQS